MPKFNDGDGGLSIRTKLNTALEASDLITVTAPVDLDNLPAGPKGDTPAHQWSGTQVRFENPAGGWGSYVDLKGGNGANGPGWTGVTYDPSDGKITFASSDGLGYTTADVRGGAGTNGDDGWAPVLATEVHGERRVHKIVDWTGGAGSKPATGKYIGPLGLVSAVGDGVDIRGAAGSGGSGAGDMLAATYDPQGVGGDAFDRTKHTGGQTLSTISDAGTAAALDAPSSGNASVGQVVKGDDTRLSDTRTPKAHTHVMANISDLPTLGTAASLDAPSSGNASAGEVVKGNDDRLTNSRAPTAHTHTVAQISDFPTLKPVATSGAYSDLDGKPTLGTAAPLNVPASGNAAAGEVVKGNDGRLTDNRAPTSHTHTASDVTDFQSAVSGNTDVAANTLKAPNATHTGEVTGSTYLTIAPGAVTNTKLADVATKTIKGRTAAGTGVAKDLTATEVRGIINVADGATKNATDLHLLDRDNHTGTQAHTTITGLGTAATMNVGTSTGNVVGVLAGGKLPVLDGSNLTGISAGGSGDMDAATYDPQGKAADAFARGTHTGTQLLATISDAKELAGLDRATVAQIRNLTGDVGVTTARIKDALVAITPSGTTNLAPAWGDFIAATWVVTANRVLSNPTGVIPGSTVSITIKSNNATKRTITFGSYYKGDLPTVEVNNTDHVTLFLYAASATQILVSHVEWSA